MKRLFIGTKADISLFEGIYPKLKKEFSQAVYGNWVAPVNLHFTYSFLGSVAEEKIPSILEALKDELQEHDSSLSFRGIGAFPNLRKPRAVFIKIINPDNKVIQLQERIARKLESLGFPPEDREYSPHLTILRVKDMFPSEFREAVGIYRNHDFGSMNSFRISLIESKTLPTGPIYKEITY